MPPGVILPDNVTQFPAAPALAADREKLDTLGGQISSLVHGYNELKRSLIQENTVEVKAKFAALLDARRQSIEAAIDAWKAQHAQVGTATQALPALRGLGAMDLATLQTQIGGEQSKLAALQAYYAAYKLSVESGTAPPAMPPELAGGVLGISSGTIIAGIALLAAGWFLFMRKE